jgi:hypothetical protein
MASMLAK